MLEKGQIKQVELIKLSIGVSSVLDDYTLVKHGLELEQIMKPALRGMMFQIRTYILAEEIDNRSKVVSITNTFPVYRSWWQHFKGEVFPEWLKRRFPPQFNYATKTGSKIVTFRKYATYPKANILFPDKVGNLVRYKSFIEEEIE